MESITEFSDRVINNVETVIVGKRQQIELLMVALLCRGHVLLEDVPGTSWVVAVLFSQHDSRLPTLPDSQLRARRAGRPSRWVRDIGRASPAKYQRRRLRACICHLSLAAGGVADSTLGVALAQ